jgi:signal transduction histidine kinase
LVDVASIEAGALAVTREPSQPSQVLNDAVNSLQALASANGLTLGTSFEPMLPTVSLDAARIHQVLINLISNAIKFTRKRGTITVCARRSGADIRIDVSDTGIGIPSEKLEAVFNRFVQIKKNDQRGVGLGLYISRCIVEGHGGRIWAESKIDEGTTVSFTLPADA